MSESAASDRVLIVGAGIVGIGCAHYLSKSGFEVTVIDRGSVAGACSHANCGYICPSHLLPLTEPGVIGTAIKSLFNPKAAFRVKPTLSPALWNWMWQFAKRCNRQQMLTAGGHLQAILDASMEEYRRLVVEESLECEWKDSGLLFVMRTDRGMREFVETARLLSEQFGITSQQIEDQNLPAFDPALKPGLAGGVHFPDDASVRPDLLNAQWAERMRDRGVKFVEHCELLKVVKSAGKIMHLETSLGQMEADQYVFATGAWSTRLSADLECKIPIQPGKGYSVTLPRPTLCPRYPILLPEHKVGISPFREGLRLGSMMEFTGYDSSIPALRIDQLREAAGHYLIDPISQQYQHSWYGWRPMTWDSLPIIGRTPRLDNAYLAAGHNMLGTSLATSTGKLIAEIIQSRDPHIDPTPYRPERF